MTAMEPSKKATLTQHQLLATHSPTRSPFKWWVRTRRIRCAITRTPVANMCTPLRAETDVSALAQPFQSVSEVVPAEKDDAPALITCSIVVLKNMVTRDVASYVIIWVGAPSECYFSASHSRAHISLEPCGASAYQYSAMM